MLYLVVFVISIIVIVLIVSSENSGNSGNSTVPQEVLQINTSLSYFRDCHLLILKRRTSNIGNVIKAEASRNINLTSVPDKLVYTGATVGGVSTGGFHVQKGGNYVSLGAKTGRYYLSYKYAEAYNGKYRSDIVSFVESTDPDFALAKNDNVLRRYIASPETKKKFSSFHRSDQFNKCTHLLCLIDLPKLDAEYIVKWMSGNN